VILEETDRLFTCDYCRVKSYLITKDVFRYMLPCNPSETNMLVFFPYWRFKGMLFSCIPNGIQHKFIDVSHQAIDSRMFPLTLGLRSQALKLQFVEPETAGRFLKPTQSFEDIKHRFEQRYAKTLPKPVLHHAHIGETLSLIYAPFYVADKIYDAVLNSPISAKLADDFDVEQLPGGKPEWRIDFISTLCPHCGWDLEGKRDALVLMCKNCNSAWYSAGKTLKKLKFGKHPTKEEEILFLPFWRIRADVSGITLNSYADLIKLANMPKVVQSGWTDIGFRFWVPAFKVRPKIFLQLSNHMTLSQPNKELIVELPRKRHHPITLPITEAIESLKVNLANCMKPRAILADIIQDIEINPKSFALIYVPFLEKHHEFIQPDLQFAINKNILALSDNL
jgi:hypothetical protein